MTQYPSTQKQITLNDNIYILKALTLGLQHRIEDTAIEVTYLDIIKECTTIPESLFEFIPKAELDIICTDIIEFSKPKNIKPKGKTKTTIQLIAWLMNKGHMDAQYYRLDFVEIIIAEMVEDYERSTNGR